MEATWREVGETQQKRLGQSEGLNEKKLLKGFVVAGRSIEGSTVNA